MKGRQHVQFFVPDWDDKVDPRFDFDSDAWSGKSPEERRDKYAHQVFGRGPYDGMLVSLAQIRKKKGVLKNGAGEFDENTSVRKQLHLPKSMALMGDCGAFTYAHQSEPPYAPEEAAGLYGALGFDVGASVDHVVFPGMTLPDGNGGRREMTEAELRRRVRITKDNAERFIKARDERGWAFEPMGVIQALTPKEFARSFLDYVEMGYMYVALGGVVPKKTEEIVSILEAVCKARTSSPAAEGVRLHLFGVVRDEISPRLVEMGVTSFDSASYLRKAWLRAAKNYVTKDGEWYAAVRVPFASDKRLQQAAAPERLVKLEERCLQLLVRYGRKAVKIGDVLPAIMEYDRMLLRRTDDTDGMEAAYRRTLEDAPWRSCTCTMCRNIGIHVAIFRGINRNRRRGFHNLWALRQQLTKLERKTNTVGRRSNK